MNLVRKISVKMDNNNIMHYQVNSNVFGGSGVVSDIIKEDMFFDIYVKEVDSDIKAIWKSFNLSHVIHIEYYTQL
jgi:hypothetical protein